MEIQIKTLPISSLIRPFAVFLTCALTAPSFAQTKDVENVVSSENSSVPIEVFNGPKFKKVLPAEYFYPPSERRLGRSGWINVGFMVDPKGKPYEISVDQSSGNKRLEEAARQYVSTFTFVPASLNGQPVDSALEVRVVFENYDEWVRSEFLENYRRLVKAVDDKDRAAADAAMQNLQVKKLAEDAYFALAQYAYAKAWGTVQQQLDALQRAVALEGTKYLSKQDLDFAIRSLLSLQLTAHDYAGATSTITKLRKRGIDEATSDELKSIETKLETLRTSANAYPVSGEIVSGQWHLRLFKKQFRFNVSEGRISEIKLYCDKKYVFFQFDPALDYKIDDKYGKCFMTVVGDPGTKFELIQS